MSGKRSVAKEAARLLAGLGDTPDEIAAMLRGAGYKGKRFNPKACPCGSCLRDHMGVDVAVGFMYGAMVLAEGHIFDAAQHVTDFVSAFDEGRYPDLIAEKP